MFPKKWISHYNTQDYNGHWSVIALMSPNGKSDAIYASLSKNDQLQETDVLDTCPYFKKILYQLEI